MTLATYLDHALQTPFAWGEADCALFAANWVKEARGLDGGAAFRGRYRTAMGCQRLLNRAGGLLVVFSEAADGIGLERTCEPVAGDIGLITCMTLRGPGTAASICVGRRWIVRTINGLSSGLFAPIVAWRV